MTRDDLLAIARSREVAAFLRLVRACEGTDGHAGYRMLFGGETVDDLSDHPRRLVVKSGYRSTAAGAYQFLATTWDRMRVRYALPDFSPESQDAAAVGLLISRDAIDDLRAGRIEDAIDKCNDEWASLPGSPYGQPTRPLAWCLERYAQLLEPAPIEARTSPQPHQEEPVAPILAAAAPGLVQALIGTLLDVAPDLARIFGNKNSEVSVRNTAAAIKVLEVAKRVANTETPAAAVERIVTDERVAADFRQEVREVIELVEAGGGGIEGARRHNREMVERGGWAGIGWGVVIGVLALGVVLGGGALMGWMAVLEATRPEVTAQILDYFKAAGFIVLGYVFGTSRSSQRKTDLLAEKVK